MQVRQAALEREKVLAIIGNSEVATPGCAVAIFRDGQSQFIFSGFADIDSGRRPDADTLYYAGSLAKQFTALAVIQLVVKGLVDLEENVCCYLPEMKQSSPPIKVAMLLHHTSGLPNYAKLAPLAGYRKASDIDRDTTLRMLLNYPGSTFPPGATFEYSNGGYLLLAAIVERMSGEPFADYVRAHILDPLGMARSLVLRDELPADPNRARGYVPVEGGFAISEDVPRFGGAGAMMFTLNDLDRYFHDISVGMRVWTPQIASLMTRQGVYADGSPIALPVPGHIFGYAGGLMLSRDWILHGGNFAGYQALFAWLPGTRNGLALLSNRGDVDPLQLASQIAAAVAPDLPAPDLARYTLCKPSGRFVSDVLGILYDIALFGDGDLEVAMTPPGRAPSATLTFHRITDEVFECGPIGLVFDPDFRGLRSQNENVSLRLRRVSN